MNPRDGCDAYEMSSNECFLGADERLVEVRKNLAEGPGFIDCGKCPRICHSQRSEEFLFRRSQATRFIPPAIASRNIRLAPADQIFLLRRQRNLVIAGSFIVFRRVRQAVLIAQIFLDLRINFVYRFFFRNFVQFSAGGLGNLLQNFLSVRPLFLRRSSSAPPASTLAHAKSAAISVFFVILE